jgi:glutamine amidotransferase
MFSVKNACDHVGFDSELTMDKKKILQADGAILPGVGAFNEAMYNLRILDLISPIKDFIASGKPFFGICLGMQLLFSESEEFENTEGLNIIKGRVVKFPKKDNQNKRIKVPHIGWSQINRSSNCAELWKNSPLYQIYPGEYMYFVHSLYAVPSNEKTILSTTNYRGMVFCSSIIKNNVFATQFHPEKSAKKGLTIYDYWGKLIEKGMRE